MPQYGRMPTEKMGFLCRNGVAISINGTYGCYVIRIKIDYYMDISSYQLRIEHTWNRSTNIRYTFNSPQDMPANVCVCVCSFNHFSLLSLGHGTVIDVVMSTSYTHT